MRYKVTPMRDIKEGDTRTIGRFLWLPKKIGNEWRWLEYAIWKQVVMRLTSLAADSHTHHTVLKWVAKEWIEANKEGPPLPIPPAPLRPTAEQLINRG